MRGFAAIGLIQPKHIKNIGGVLRAAQVYRAAMVAIQGDRTPIRQREDTGKAYKHIPVVRGNDIHDLCPLGAKRIAVDLVDYAKPLPTYQHPESAFYIFGPEDGTLDESILSSFLRVLLDD